MNGVPINSIRYADDTVILARSQLELQGLINLVVQTSASFGLRVNPSKTKVVVFSKAPEVATVWIDGRALEQVASYKYLGALVNGQCNQRMEVVSRIAQAKRAFAEMKRFFVRSDLSLELRVRMLRCYVFSVFLYGCESWTLNAYLEGRIEALEMYLYRRILKIPWVDRVTNEEVLRRMRKPRELLLTVKERKARYLGHIMRGEKYDVLRFIIEGKIEGKRSIGRRQNSWLKDLRTWFGCTSVELFRAAASRESFASLIANLRMETA